MKKNILMRLILLCPVVVMNQSLLCQTVNSTGTTDGTTEMDTNHDRDQVEDFFGEPDMSEQATVAKKEKPSKMRLLMIQVGVAIALRTQAVYSWIYSILAYLNSWVTREKKSA